MRTSRRFLPTACDGLENRLALNHGVTAVHAHAAHVTHRSVHKTQTTLPPAQEINAQCDSFAADFVQAESLYAATLTTAPSANSSSTGTTTTSSSAAVFQGFITARTQQMSENLVRYFNALPIKLPRSAGTAGFSGPRTAIQSYLQQTITGTTPTSLNGGLLAIPLPTSPGPSVSLYEQATSSVIESTMSEMLSGVTSLFKYGDQTGYNPTATKLNPTTSTTSGTTGG